MKKLSVVLATVLLIAGVRELRAQGKSIILERVLVRVNGEILTQSQLTDHQTDAIRERNKIAPGAPVPDQVVMQLLNEVTPDVLVDSVDELLLVQHGREIGAKFTDEQFKGRVDEIKKDNKLDDDGLKKAMAAENMTMDELRSNFERAYLVQAVQQREIYPHMSITEEELRQYYNGHKESFMTTETVTLRELFVGGPAAAQPADAVGSSNDVAAKAKIDSIRARAQNGEDFAGLVKEVSESPTKANGGLVGPVNLQDVNPVIKDLIASLRPGDVSPPLRGPRGGYQIFKLEARATPDLKAFSTVRDDIEQAIRNDRLGGETEKTLQRLRAQAVIEWKDENLKQIYEKRLVEKAKESK